MYPKITLCIPTYQRFDFLKTNLVEYLKNPYIDEIVISDENGADNLQIQQHFPDQPKLKLFSNERILGPFLNKNKAVSYASNEWVCLMDSDNFAPVEYFEAWAKYIQKHELDTQTVYMPIRTIPQRGHRGFDYSEFQKMVWSKQTICLKNLDKLNCMLNTGNYIFYRQTYLDADQLHPELHDKCDVVDVLLKNILMCKNGAKMVLVPDMTYHHIVHLKSFFLQNRRHNYKRSYDNVKQLVQEF